MTSKEALERLLGMPESSIEQCLAAAIRIRHTPMTVDVSGALMVRFWVALLREKRRRS